MKVNQQAIAEILGLDRTTVTKILNRDPKYSASPTTRERVFRAAEMLGYDFATIRRPFKREHGRTEMNSPCEITLTLDDGTVFDAGTAVVRNLSVGGALLTGLNLGKQVLPLRSFTILIQFPEIPELAGLVGECEVVRLAGFAETGAPELGVRFVNATHRDRRRIADLVRKLVDLKVGRGSVGEQRASPRADGNAVRGGAAPAGADGPGAEAGPRS